MPFIHKLYTNYLRATRKLVQNDLEIGVATMGVVCCVVLYKKYLTRNTMRLCWMWLLITSWWFVCRWVARGDTTDCNSSCSLFPSQTICHSTTAMHNARAHTDMPDTTFTHFTSAVCIMGVTQRGREKGASGRRQQMVPDFPKMLG